MSKKKVGKEVNAIDPNRVICYKGLKTVLRPVNVEHDLPYCTKWINDEYVIRFLKAISPTTEAREREYLEGIGKDPNNIVYAIETLEDAKFIGMMGLHRIDWIGRMATTGSIIGDKDYWGKGYGTDAKMLLLNHAFNRLDLRRINSSTIAYNKRSAGCLLKCGYKQEGVRKGYYYRDGKHWDQYLFRVFKPEFIPLWKEYAKKLQQEDEAK